MIPNMNLTHLKYFMDAVLLNSVSAAARENYISQSAISQGIIKLEQALQLKLTTHQRPGFKLTEEGQIVFQEARRVFAAIEHLKDRITELNGEISGNVSFACTNAIAQYFLPKHYLKIKKSYPLVHLKFHRGGLHAIHEMLKQEKVSFAIALEASEFNGYEKQVLAKGYFRFYKKKGIKNCSEVFIDHPENAEVIEFSTRYYKQFKKAFVFQDNLSGWGMVATFVQNGCGIGFLPDFIFKENKGIEEVDFGVPLIEYHICAFKLKGTALSRAAKAVLGIFKECSMADVAHL